MTWRIAVLGLAWIMVAVAVAGFFLPWAKIDAREPSLVKQMRQMVPLQDTVSGLTKDLSHIAVKVRRGTEVITGRLPSLSDLPRHVSGFQIPQVANQEQAKVALALFELVTNERRDLGIKSYAVYAVPGIALLCAVLLTIIARPIAIALTSALLCAALAGIGFWKLLTVHPDSLFVAITIGPGLWLSIWAYVGLVIASSLDALRRSRRP